MTGATASGASAPNSKDGGTARNRDHNQGNQERKYTVEQKAAVLRIRRCQPTAFYDILALEEVRSSCTEADIKKAYRKQSLLTHPDKNGHEHADEAFKMVARAFSVLGDKEKRDKFDRFGTDPDSRFESTRAQNPFSGFGQRNAGGAPRPGGGGFPGGGFEEEISPEEMFRRFFGGGGFVPFAGGGFDTGPQFVWNMGGGPGIRVHQFGGNRPRRRPREGEQPQDASVLSTLLGLLPILFLFVLPLLSSLFSGSTAPAMPQMVFDHPRAPFTHRHVLPDSKINFFIQESDWANFKDKPHKISQLESHAYVLRVNTLRQECHNEMQHKIRLREAAQGWFFQDPEKMKLADRHPTPACDRLRKLGENFM